MFKFGTCLGSCLVIKPTNKKPKYSDWMFTNFIQLAIYTLKFDRFLIIKQIECVTPVSDFCTELVWLSFNNRTAVPGLFESFNCFCVDLSLSCFQLIEYWYFNMIPNVQTPRIPVELLSLSYISMAWIIHHIYMYILRATFKIINAFYIWVDYAHD